jgi:hypothetical protein
MRPKSVEDSAKIDKSGEIRINELQARADRRKADQKTVGKRKGPLD